MRVVEWTDTGGYLRKRLIRDGDPDQMAMMGIPIEPPSLESLDWDAVKRDLHNQLLARGLLTLSDLGRSKDGLLGAINAALGKKILELYMTLSNEQEDKK